jgi:UDP-glucose 6-dehydrogenase
VGLSISVFGMGYGGSVTAGCFAHVDHKVTRCLGRDQIVIDLINLASASRPATAAPYQGICW